MEKSSEILVAIKALQTHIGGQIQATNKTLQEFMYSMDSHFAELELRPRISLHTNSSKFGFNTDNSHGRTEISSFQRSMKMDVPKFGSFPYNNPQGLLPKLTQTPTITQFQLAFENLRNKEGSELKFSELETTVEADEGLISSTTETRADGNIVNESDCKMGEITNYVVHIEAMEEEKQKTPCAYFANGIPLFHSFAAIIPINYMCANKEKDGKRIPELVDFPLLLLQEHDEKINLVVEQLKLGRPYKAQVARRRTTFKLYALKEVYVEYLNLHLEDKVVLKGRRVDTIM